MNPTRKLHRGHMVQLVALVAAVASGNVVAQATSTGSGQAWPSKPISLIAPFPAGGTTDVLACALAEKLTQSLGQTVIVESKPGAGATLGADYVAKARPGGYTLLVGAVHHTIASSVHKKLPCDFQKDLAPITVLRYRDAGAAAHRGRQAARWPSRSGTARNRWPRKSRARPRSSRSWSRMRR